MFLSTVLDKQWTPTGAGPVVPEKEEEEVLLNYFRRGQCLQNDPFCIELGGVNHESIQSST